MQLLLQHQQLPGPQDAPLKIQSTHTHRPLHQQQVQPSCCLAVPFSPAGDFIEEDDGEYGADLGEEDDFFNRGDASLSGKKRKGEGAGKGACGWVCGCAGVGGG